MKEQNEKEIQTEKKGKVKKARMNKERRFYLATALGCVVAMIAIVVAAVFVTGDKVENQAGNNNGSENNSPLPPDDENSENTGNTPSDKPNDDEQVTVTPEGLVSPLQTMTILNEHGFYYNQTLNCYYEHMGLDVSAAAGTSVLAVEEGKVETIYKDDLLSGTEIVINHGDGLKSVYRFVTEAEGLKVGDSVKKGDVIGVVAEASGDEYKDGAHLHFEILKNDVSVDPTTYLTLEEK